MRIGAVLTLLVLVFACPGCDSGSLRLDGPDGGRLYVASGATDEVLQLDPSDGRIVTRFSLDRRRDEIDEPHGIALSPDGRHWYATVSHGNPTLWKFELPGDRLVGRVALGTYGAARIGVTPDGARGFIPDYYRSGQGKDSGLAVVDLFDLTIIARPTICPAPHDAQVDPGGRIVAVACSLSDEIVLMDVATLEVIGRFYVDPDPGLPGNPRFKPLNILWSPSGETLYVTLHAADAVRAFDLLGKTLGTVEVGAGPAQLALSRDGRTLVTANRKGGSMSILELPAFVERARVNLGRPYPHGVALDSSNGRAFVSCEGTVDTGGGVVAVDLQTEEIVWSAEAGAYTLGVVYVPSG
jgi:DNA-binding beta-propeller fold protein YncE